MEWELKPPSCDLAELERETAQTNMGFVVGSSSLGGQKSKGDCSVDLKLGRLGDFGDGSLEKWNNSRVSTMAPPLPPAPSKRARAPNNGSQNFSCLVDGCKADLSNCRDYHKRHKVCEAHSKTPRVMVGGQEQRFCQQCSRFHLLAEFDEVKRSCRKRLDGHNRRRRKPQPDSMSSNSGSLFSNHQGTRFSSYMNPQIFPISMPEANWAAVVKSEEDTLYNRHTPLHFVERQSLFPCSFSRGYKEGKQFPFLQDSTIASSESSGSKIFADTLTRDCALSLLSTPEQTSGIGLTHMVQQPERIPMAQPLVSGIQYNGLGRYSCSQASNSVSTTGFSCSGIEDEQVGTVLVSGASNAGLHCQGIFHVGDDGSSENGPSQTLPFSWQ